MKHNSRILLKCLCLLISIFFILAGCSNNDKPASSENKGDTGKVTELKLITFLPQDHRNVKDIVPLFIKKIEEGTKGAVKVKWVGGPESIPAEDQFDAVKNGMVDISFIANAYYTNLMPVSDSLMLSPYSVAEERENGYFDFLSKQFDQQGIVYLGRWLMNSPFYIWTNKDVHSLKDLKGAKFRSNPVYHELFNRLGAAPINVDTADVYMALERKMVDGFGYPLLGPRDSGWTEVTKNFIDEPFLEQNCTILMNPDFLASLSPELQQQIKDISKEFEVAAAKYWKQQNVDEKKALKEAGVKAIKLSDKEAKELQKIVKEIKWEELQKKVDPSLYDEVMKLLYKE